MRILLLILTLFSIPAFAATLSCPPAQETIGDAVVRRECDAATGMVTKEEWKVDGLLHRENGPARVTVKRDGDREIVSQEYWHNGERQTDAGPDVKIYNMAAGVLETEQWMKNGKLHRERLPAIITYNPETGEVASKEYWLGGERQTGPQE